MTDMRLTLIEQIKMIRSLTGMGLVESKIAVECFGRAQGLVEGNWITTVSELQNFIRYCALFIQGKVQVDSDKYSIFPAMPRALTSEELYTMFASPF